MKWEYNKLLIRSERWANLLNYESIRGYMNELGEDGWELVAVCDDWAYFKRPKGIDEAAIIKGIYGRQEEAVKEAHSEEDTGQSQRCSTAGELYTAGYHPVINEEW